MTLEQKIDICLEFIATTDMSRLPELKQLAKEALKTRASEAKTEEVKGEPKKTEVVHRETCLDVLKREYPRDWEELKRIYCPYVFGYAPTPIDCQQNSCAKCWDRPVQNVGG